MRDAARRHQIRSEASELAAALARALLRTGDDGLAINDLFRTAHSLKGLAGLLDAGESVRLANSIEDVLDDLRHGRIQLLPGLRATLHQAIERCDALLHRDELDDDDIVERLRALRSESALESVDDPLAGLELPAFVAEALTDYELARLRENLRLDMLVHRVTAGFPLETFDGGLEEIHRRVGIDGEQIATLPASTDAEISFEILVASRLDAGALAGRLGDLVLRIEPVPRRGAQLPEAHDATPGPPQRVRVSLDALRAVEEASRHLAVAVAGLEARGELEAVIDGVARLQQLTHALGHMSAAGLCERAEQTIAAVARAWGRQVVLVVEGRETELPVAICEALVDPLLHLVRNAIDHGIEAPGERSRRGKPIEGTIRLTFHGDEDEIRVELADDGGGIDADRLGDAALSHGIDRAAFDRLSWEEQLALIFEPGFSTAGSLGHSGRGVGLDAVRVDLRRLGGEVRVASRPGEGTVFTLRLPIRPPGA